MKFHAKQAVIMPSLPAGRINVGVHPAGMKSWPEIVLTMVVLAVVRAIRPIHFIFGHSYAKKLNPFKILSVLKKKST